MTAAHDYEHLHDLVDRLSPTQVRRLRLIITEDEELSQVDQQIPDGPGGGGDEGDLLPDSFLALSGSIEAPAATRSIGLPPSSTGISALSGRNTYPHRPSCHR